MNARPNPLDEEINRRGGARAVANRSYDDAAVDYDPQDDGVSLLLPPWARAMRDWQPPADVPYVPRPVTMAVEQLIPRGKVGPLVSAGGTGKTTLAVTMSVCGAIRRPFLGLEVAEGSFAIISNDDEQEDLAEALELVIRANKLSPSERALARSRVRLHSLKGAPGVKSFSTVQGGAPTPTDLPLYIVEALRHVPDLQIVFLDTLRQTAGGKTNDEDVITIAIDGAGYIAQQLGCAVVFNHHTGKANFRDGIEDMYCGTGSAAIADNSRFVLLLKSATWSDVGNALKRTGQEKGDPLVLMSMRGNIRMRAAAPIFLHRDGYLMARIAGEPLTREQVLDKRDREILLAVRHGAQTKTTIFAAVKGRKKAVCDAVDDLRHRGLLENGSPNGSETRPLFVLTGEGARYLEVTK